MESPAVHTPEILAAQLLLRQLDRLDEEDADTMLELLEKRLPKMYRDMDLDVAQRLTMTAEGQREMATRLLLDALGLEQDDTLVNRPQMLARRYLNTLAPRAPAKKDASSTPAPGAPAPAGGSKKRPRQTLAEKREDQRRVLVHNLDRLPACQRRVPPVFLPGTEYRLELASDEEAPGLRDAGLVVLVHNTIWQILMRNVGRENVADDTGAPVIELVTWTRQGDFSEISERVLVRPYGAHERLDDDDMTLLLTNQRTLNQLRRPYRRLTVQLCHRMPTVGFITFRFYGTASDRAALDTPTMSGDTLIKTTAQAMLQWAPGVMLGQEYVFPRFTLRVEGILDNSPNMRSVFVARIPVGLTSILYEIENETEDPFVASRYIGIPVPTHAPRSDDHTMCALCGMHAAGQCASCDAPLCGESCHYMHFMLGTCITMH